MSNHFCHICGGLVDLIKLQPSGVRLCECENRFSKLRAENRRLKAELAEAKKDAELVDACHEFINSPTSVESCERFNKTLEARKGK